MKHTEAGDRELKKGSAGLLVLSLVEARARHGCEIDRLARELARVEPAVPLDPPVLGQGRQTLMATLRQDLRYAVRAARMAPLYSAIVIATLALAIGANTAIFSVIDAVMLRP